MPQDVTFGLPFDTPVSRHLGAQERHLGWITDMVLIRGQAGVRRAQVTSSAADRRPHLPIEGLRCRG